MSSNQILKAEESVSTPTHGPPNHILVVDDDVGILQLSARILTISSYHVDTAEDGVAAWEALHASSYNPLITDHNMPKVSGVELVKKMRSARMTIPVVLSSSAIPMDELNRNPSLQLATTLFKPFTMDALLGTVEKVLSASTGSTPCAGSALP